MDLFCVLLFISTSFYWLPSFSTIIESFPYVSGEVIAKDPASILYTNGDPRRGCFLTKGLFVSKFMGKLFFILLGCLFLGLRDEDKGMEYHN